MTANLSLLFQPNAQPSVTTKIGVPVLPAPSYKFLVFKHPELRNLTANEKPDRIHETRKSRVTRLTKNGKTGFVKSHDL
jgi:hypothetical protein